ncbi:hypothetical protein, partial [Klebsiella pneumoniae]|uniref:hypothetical protein n=1 Tax=Klebsiella pneumoniae TaxID=573 RepID=UPI001D0EDA1D
PLSIRPQYVVKVLLNTRRTELFFFFITGRGQQCWYALYSSPPGGTIHESWWDRTITLKT